MKAIQLMLRLRSLNVPIWLDHDQLRLGVGADELDSALLAGLREHEAEIKAFLRDARGVDFEADGIDASSCYIELPDGIRLAADIFRPVRDGAVVAQPLPVLWCLERYHRSTMDGGVYLSKLDSRPWLARVLATGYVIATVDGRGTGGSTGSRSHEFSDTDATDGYAVTEWLAAQPWCDGNVGMYGDSYLGVAQLLVASKAPPHLKAIFPEMSMFDLYAFLYPGGVFRHDFVRRWGERVGRLDTTATALAASTPRAMTGVVASRHHDNSDVFAAAAEHPHRDDPGSLYERVSPHLLADRISASGVAVHHLSGWYDIWVRDAVLWFGNLTTAQRLTIGPWWHTVRGGVDLAAEYLRWFDYWLKGIDTGVMDEPPIRYFTMSAKPGTEWRSATSWPPAEVAPMVWYFHAGPAGGPPSVNNGALRDHPPTQQAEHDEYQVDYGASTGRTTRWANGYGADFRYQLTDNDRRAVTYTSDVLTEDLEVTGHPVVQLYVTSSHPDGDFFVYLEEVDEHDQSHYVTEGVLRASHRVVGPAPYHCPDVPYHPGRAVDVEELPSVPVELGIELHPTSNVFVAGRRIRVAVTCCDADNAETPVWQPPPVVSIHRSARCPSSISLPVMPVAGRRPVDTKDSDVRTLGGLA